MSKLIRNPRQADITVHTPLGAFFFAAGKSVELADDRAKAVQESGKWYFAEGDLTEEDAPLPDDKKADLSAEAEAEAKAKADVEAAAQQAAKDAANAETQAPAEGELTADDAATAAKKKGR